jgi:D-alanine-D-alanine ligase-like ATP-grasp enzyme
LAQKASVKVVMAANFSAMALGIFSDMLTAALCGIDIFTDHAAES